MHDALAATVDLLEQGRFDEAATQAKALRVRFSNDPEPARLHGIALLQLGRTGEAVDALATARTLAPTSIEVACNLGSALLAADDTGAALAVLEEARRSAPDHPAVLNGLGNAHTARGDAAAAREAYLAATRSAPGHLGAWVNLVAAELALGRIAEAERLARGLLAQATHPQLELLLGQALLAQQRHNEAAEAFERGERLAPADARFAYQLGLVAEERRQLGEASAAFRRALTIDPGMGAALAQLVFIERQRIAWNGLDALSRRLRDAVAAEVPGITPFGFLAEPADALEQRRCATTFARRLARVPAFEHARRASDAPLRVGFVSNGFGNHPTGLLTVAVFEALRALPIDAQLFATAPPDGKAVEQRLRNAARWHQAHGLAPRALAERLHASGAEILVDLRVWGGGNVSEAFALRPAPVQVNWLAYPGTSGAPWLDYVVADRVALPESMRAAYSERVAWLPRCFQPSDPTRTVGAPPAREACGLPASGVVYVCFNNSYKLNPRSITRMFAILHGVPGSVLWLLEGPAGADEALRGHARERGLDPSRLVFMPKLAHDEYLARYRHADLFLDCNPYNAHTTASDAIWAGCPVLTVAGDTFAGRVAASLNIHLGIDDLVAADDDAFITTAIHLGGDADARRNLRMRVASARAQSGLFDMQGFAADFADLLWRIARRHREGLAPIAIDDTVPAR